MADKNDLKNKKDEANSQPTQLENNEKKSVLDSIKKNTAEIKTIAGLEEIPEEIQKRLEKRQADKEQKGKGKIKKKKKKIPRKVTVGKAYIKATYNNTIVTLTDLQGNVLSWASAGIAGFKGPKKSTPYAAQIITRLAVGKAREEYGLSEVAVFVRGVGTGRESAIRALNNNGLIINTIKDITPIPHNGCRPKKPRRV
jgi:small subunit ribosomal protein S11